MNRLLLKLTRSSARINTACVCLFIFLIILSHNIIQTQSVQYGSGFLDGNNSEIRYSFKLYKARVSLGEFGLINIATGLEFDNSANLLESSLDAREADAVELLASFSIEPVRLDGNLHRVVVAMQVIVPLLVVMVILFWMRKCLHVMKASEICNKCGYNLEGISIQICPECGQIPN